MAEFEVEGMEAFVRELNKVEKFPKEMKAQLRTGTRKIGREAVKRMKPSIPKAKRVFNVRRKGGPDMDIQPGTLRRSLGVKKVRGSTTLAMVGPRSGGVAEKNDGWFAGIVEDGHVTGRGNSVGSPAYNKIVPAIQRQLPSMNRQLRALYATLFNKYMQL